MANLQRGRFGACALEASQISAAQMVRLGTSSMAPVLGCRIDYTSGGNSDNPKTQHNTYAPIANNVYFSYQGLLSATNLIAAAPNVTVFPLKSLRVTTEYQLSWKTHPFEPVYRAAETAFAGTEHSHARFTGHLVRTQAERSMTRRLTVIGRFEHFGAGSLIRRNNAPRSNYFTLWSSFRY